MKKLYTLLAFIATTVIFAQAPQGFNYQATVRNSAGDLIVNQNVYFKFNLMLNSASSVPVFSETHYTPTDDLGQVNIVIGQGTATVGNFSTINWGNGNYYLGIELNTGAGYVAMGTTQLLSVPYALYANSSGNAQAATPNLADVLAVNNGANNLQIKNLADPTEAQDAVTKAYAQNLVSQVSQLPSGNSNGDMLYWNGTQWIELSPGQPGQILQINSDNIPTWLTPTGLTAGQLATIQTTSVAVGYNSAVVNGNLINNGNQLILAKGICFSQQPNPSLGNTVIASDNELGPFTVTIPDLTPGTTYYVRAFATNTIGTSFGDELTFTNTSLIMPLVATGQPSNITETAAQVYGDVTNNGGNIILDRGFYWGTDATSLTNQITLNAGTDSFSATISSLTAGQTYYYKAYATNSQGTGYGAVTSFTTAILTPPSVLTSTAQNITYNSVSLGGQILNASNATITERGICYSLSSIPTINDTVVQDAVSGNETISVALTNLESASAYHVRAYIKINGDSTPIYGNEIIFTTLTICLVNLSTITPYAIAATSAASGGIISCDGGNPITSKGVCWSTDPNPEISDSNDHFTNDGSGTGTFNSVFQPLVASTTYYVRAYVINSLGNIIYGNESSFVTIAVNPIVVGVPIIGTKQIVKSDPNYNSGGYVSNSGGSAITQLGLCYSTTTNPQIGASGVTTVYSTSTQTGEGYFDAPPIGTIPVSCGVTYYFKAFAINATGIGYGNEITMSSGFDAALTTVDVSSITANTATSGGVINTDGGCAVTERGVCWSTSPNPTTSSFKTLCGTGGGTYSCDLTNLVPNNIYYVRAYAITAKGTFYGDQKQLTTGNSTSLYIGQSYAGGIIFYLDSSGNHGLVCADADQGSYYWGCNGTLMGATGTAIGTGASNTAAIIAGCTENNIAAKICDDLVLNGYNDWFLPSKLELNAMYQNLLVNGIGNFSSSYCSNYLTSSEDGPQSVWLQVFSPGCGSANSGSYLNGFNKNNRNLIRAVRAF
jgi:hypothetical protein